MQKVYFLRMFYLGTFIFIIFHIHIILLLGIITGIITYIPKSNSFTFIRFPEGNAFGLFPYILPCQLSTKIIKISNNSFTVFEQMPLAFPNNWKGINKNIFFK
jgi:hypothetical protein